MRRQSELYCRIDASPVAGILVTLLFFLAFITPNPHFSLERSAELVKSSHSIPIPGALREDAMQVGISASGDVYYRSVHIPPEELRHRIRDGLSSGAEKRIYLIVDGRTKYWDIAIVLHELQFTGIEDVSFITK